MKRELRDVMRLLNELESALRNDEMRVLTLGREIKELTSRLDRLETEKREAEKQAMTSGHMLQQLDSEMARVSERLETCRHEIQRLASERSEQESLISSRQAESATLQQQREALEAQATTANEELAGMRERRDTAAQSASQRLARVATLEERHRSATAVLEKIEAVVADMDARAAALQLQIESSAVEKLQRETENQQIIDQLEELEAERNTTEARDGLLQFESDQVRARFGEIEESLRDARQSLDQARDQRGELSAAAAKLQSDAQYMAETCLNELSIQRHEIMADTTIPIVSGDQLASEDQVHREMRLAWTPWGP